MKMKMETNRYEIMRRREDGKRWRWTMGSQKQLRMALANKETTTQQTLPTLYQPAADDRDPGTQHSTKVT